MNRVVMMALVSASALGLASVGCTGALDGGGGSTPQTGSLCIRAHWPEAGTELVPAASQSIGVVVNRQSSGAEVATRILTRSAPTTTVQGLEAALAYAVTATAYPNADATGTPQATGSTSVTVIANQVNNVSLALASTVTEVEVSPSCQVLGLCDSVQLAATARDASGAVVLVSGTWEWTSTNDAVATVSASGNVTAVAAGDAWVTATERESGQSGQAGVGVRSKSVLIVHDGVELQGLDAEYAQWKTNLMDAGYAVREWAPPVGASPAQIRANLQQRQGLSGVVLVGDIPMAYTIAVTGDGANRYYSLDQCDHYYMDLDGVWTEAVNVDSYLQSQREKYGDALVHPYPSVADFADRYIVMFDCPSLTDQPGNVDPYKPEVWVSRILSRGVTSAGPDAALTRSYLQRNSAYRNSPMAPASVAYVEGVEGAVGPANHGMDLSPIYTVAYDGMVAEPAQYLGLLATPTRFLFMTCHSAPEGHGFANGWVDVDDVAASGPKAQFVWLNACSSARCDYGRYLGGQYAFAPDSEGLIVVGPTGVSGYNNLEQFSAHATQNGGDVAFGEAYLEWFTFDLEQRFFPQNYTVLGDLSLTMIVPSAPDVPGPC